MKEITKKLSLEKQIIEILSHYYLDSYNRNAYYKNCSKKIVELLEQMKSIENSKRGKR